MKILYKEIESNKRAIGNFPEITHVIADELRSMGKLDTVITWRDRFIDEAQRAKSFGFGRKHNADEDEMKKALRIARDLINKARDNLGEIGEELPDTSGLDDGGYGGDGGDGGVSNNAIIWISVAFIASIIFLLLIYYFTKKPKTK
jgi:hypothetical protein